MNLEQRYLNEKRSFYLKEHHLHYDIKDGSGEREANIDYEDLTPKTRMLTVQDGRLKTITISFGIFAAIGFLCHYTGITSSLMRWAPLWLTAALILYAFYLFKMRKYLLLELTDGKVIFFLRNSPSEKAVREFISLALDTQKKYLRDRYCFIDPNRDLERELGKLQWLIVKGVITEEEYAQIRKNFSETPTSHATVVV